MTKSYTIERIEYVIRTCTAIANCDLQKSTELYNEYGDIDHEAMRRASVAASESYRQPALHVAAIAESGEINEQIVFNWQLPATYEDFEDMCNSPEDWESGFEPFAVIFDK